MNTANKILFQDKNITKFEIVSKKYGVFEVIVDTEHIEKIKDYKWHVNYVKKGKRFDSVRASNKYKSNQIYLHNFITGNKMTDHKNGNIFDNRKENLRECNYKQNPKNMKMHRDNTSGYKGVSSAGKKWSARITVDYKPINIGRFSTKEEAAKAYNEKAKELFGEFARLNLI